MNVQKHEKPVMIYELSRLVTLIDAYDAEHAQKLMETDGKIVKDSQFLMTEMARFVANHQSLLDSYPQVFAFNRLEKHGLLRRMFQDLKIKEADELDENRFIQAFDVQMFKTNFKKSLEDYLSLRFKDDAYIAKEKASKDVLGLVLSDDADNVLKSLYKDFMAYYKTIYPEYQALIEKYRFLLDEWGEDLVDGEEFKSLMPDDTSITQLSVYPSFIELGSYFVFQPSYAPDSYEVMYGVLYNHIKNL